MSRRPLDPEAWALRQRIGASLKRARLKRFRTMQEYADALTASGLDSTKSAVSLWESGSRLPELESLYKMAEVLGTTVPALLPPH